MKPLVRACVGIALAALTAFTGWVAGIEITYRKNIKAGALKLTMRSSDHGGGGGDRRMHR